VDSADEFDIRQYLDVIRRRAWVIVAAIVACALAAAAVSFSQPKLYESSARVLISAQQDISGTGNALSDPNQLQNQMQTQVQIAESPDVEAQANQALGSDVDELESIAASGVTNTRVMQITATSQSPQVAQKAANTYAEAYLKAGQQTAVDRIISIGQTVATKQQQLRDQMTAIDTKLIARPKPDPATITSLNNQKAAFQTQLDSLQRQYDTAQAGALVKEAAATTLNAAELPTAPASPNPKRNIALAIVLGALIGVGVALLWERLDDRVRSATQVALWFPKLSNLGTIPRVRDWKNRDEAKNTTMLDPRSQTAEAYRGLRTSIEFLALDRELKVIEVTSATAGEGKSTTVANLATALAWAGKKVVVVSADLRRPRVHDFFGMSNEVGLTTTLLNDKPLDEVLQRAVVDAGGGSVDVLATGQLPPNPSEVLAHSAVGEIFAQLREQFDYVLIDAPPVLPVADSLVLSKYADGIIAVAGIGDLKKDELERTIALLDGTRTETLGVLVNGGDDGLEYANKYGNYSAPDVH